MTTLRVKHNKKYTCIHNDTLRDNNLSLAARGLHHLLLSYPDDWEINVNHLHSICQEGVNKIRKLLKELEQAGYLQRFQGKDSSGKFSKGICNIYELPQGKAPIHGTGLTGSGLPKRVGIINNNKESNNKEVSINAALRESARESSLTGNFSSEDSPKESCFDQETISDTSAEGQRQNECSACSTPVTPSVVQTVPSYKLTKDDFKWLQEVYEQYRPNGWSSSAIAITQNLLRHLRQAYDEIGCNMEVLKSNVTKALRYVDRTSQLWDKDIYWMLYQQRFLELAHRDGSQKVKPLSRKMSEKITEMEELTSIVDEALKQFE